ncbi:MAG: PKD domain-containing protein [Myxococcota bacterium]
MSKSLSAGVLLLGAVVGLGCASSPPPSDPPTANAGSPKAVAVGDRVILDGSGSADAKNRALSYQWSLTAVPAGSQAELEGADRVNPSFVADVPGTFEARLVVVAGGLASAPATVTVTSTAADPVARVMDVAGQPGETLVLDGTASTSPSGKPLTFKWSVTDPKGANVSLLNQSSAQPSFRADVIGAYAITLVVNDGQKDSAPASATASVEWGLTRPVANAGPDLAVNVDDDVLLDASGSYTRNYVDGEPRPLTYQWTLSTTPIGSTATLPAGGVTVTLKPDLAGTYVVKLVVNDGLLSSEPDTVVLTVTDTNQPPVANAGPSVTVGRNTVATLNGNASFDPEGGMLTYQWTLYSAPSGSTATLANDNTASPTLTPDVFGAYRIKLVVTDAKGLSSAPSLASVFAVNNAPTAVIAGSAPIAGWVNNDVTLDATGSTDTEGDPLTYNWNVFSAPPGGGFGFTGVPQNGQIRFRGQNPGDYVIQVTVSDSAGNQATASTTVRLSRANALTIVSGNNQSAQVDSSLGAALVVRATNGAANVPGAQLVWNIAGGAMLSAAGTTDGSGSAQAYVRVGKITGAGTLKVWLAADPSVSATFNFTATAGTVTSIAVDAAPGDVINGAKVVVRTVDAFGNFATDGASASSTFGLTVTGAGAPSFASSPTRGTLVSGGGTANIVGTLSQGEFEIVLNGNVTTLLNLTLQSGGAATPVGFASWVTGAFDDAEDGTGGWTLQNGSPAWAAKVGTSTAVSGKRSFGLEQTVPDLLNNGYSAMTRQVSPTNNVQAARLSFSHRLSFSSGSDTQAQCSAHPLAFVQAKSCNSYFCGSRGLTPQGGWGVLAACDGNNGRQGFLANTNFSTVEVDLTDAVRAGFRWVSFAQTNVPNPATPVTAGSWYVDDVRARYLTLPGVQAVTAVPLLPGPGATVDLPSVLAPQVIYNQCVNTRINPLANARILDAKGNVAREYDAILKFTWNGSATLVAVTNGAMVGGPGTTEVEIQFIAGRGSIVLTDPVNETVTVNMVDSRSTGLTMPAAASVTFTNYICHSTGWYGRVWSDSTPTGTHNATQAVRACETVYGVGRCAEDGRSAYRTGFINTCESITEWHFVSYTKFGGTGCGARTDAATVGYSTEYHNYSAVPFCGCGGNPPSRSEWDHTHGTIPWN